MTPEAEQKLLAFVKGLANNVSEIVDVNEYDACEDKSDYDGGNFDDAVELGESLGRGYIARKARKLLTKLGLASDLVPLESEDDEDDAD